MWTCRKERTQDVTDDWEVILVELVEECPEVHETFERVRASGWTGRSRRKNKVEKGRGRIRSSPWRSSQRP